MTGPTTTTAFALPSLGDAGSGVTLSRWLKKTGDSVVEGEPLLEIATDKVDTEISAPFSGTLVRILAQEEDTIEEGTELAVIEHASPPEPLLQPAPVPEAVAESPAVPVAARPGARREKLTPIRRVIADRMMESLRSTAQLTSVVEVDVTSVARIRKGYKDEGRKISYLPFFIKAAVNALKLYPVFNTTAENGGTELIYHDSVNLGIAVDSPKGLMVPVIQDAQTKGIDGIAAAVEDLAGRVRSGRITPAELEGGTFTITNTGSRGALFDTPILNYPQTAILGTGTVVERVVPLPSDDVRIGIRSFAYLALTYDHRIVDGADAARFLTQVKAQIEAGTFEDR